MSDSEVLRRTPLYEAHRRAGGRLVPFAGYEMPVQYASIIAEAKAVREGAGMFDVSHMARLKFSGDGSERYLEHVTTNAISKLEMNTGQYSLLANEAGGVVDDIIVYRLPDLFYMVVNASNHEKDVAWLELHKPSSVHLKDVTDKTAMIAVQGPKAVEILSELSPLGAELAEQVAFGVVQTTFAGVEAQGARSGYTGEDGYELICEAGDAETLWDALLASGVAPCGLGARDTLRVEAGLPLYGHELGDDLNPIAAGLGWVVSRGKEFIGADPINEARATGTPTRLVGVRLNAKRLTTPGMKVLVEDRSVGQVTSGIVSPTLDTALALAYIDSEVPLGAPCTVETRGQAEAGTIVSKRFYKRPTG